MIDSAAVFNFVRGAVRSAWRLEDLRDKKFLIIGSCPDLVELFAVGGSTVYSTGEDLCAYTNAIGVCPNLLSYEGQEVDIIIDILNQYLSIKGKGFSIGDIGKDPYNQGIAEYYPI